MTIFDIVISVLWVGSTLLQNWHNKSVISALTILKDDNEYIAGDVETLFKRNAALERKIEHFTDK